MSEVFSQPPSTQECVTCGSLIDISDEEPLALIHCPTCGAAFRVRKQFGNFELLEILGAGGMGAVYRAHDHSLNRSVALKVLRREYSEQPDFVKQFEHEAALTALINHPNVVKVYSTGSGHGLLYIAMELVDKGSLDEVMTLQKQVDEGQVLEAGIQVAQGLRAAFQRGLIHRDVKPGNILFAEAHHAKIVDFGLAAKIGASSEVGGEIWGTPYYVAPEKLEQQPQEDFRSDIYSLGATLFHAVAGRPPYEATDASMVALKHLKSQPVSLQAFAPKVSTPTAYVINRALHKEPSARYASYDELIQHLEYARAQLMARPVASPRSGPRRRVVVDDLGSQRAFSFFMLLVLCALGAGGYFLYQHREEIFQGPEPTRSASAEEARKAAAQLRPNYDLGRDLLISGKDEEAAEDFRKIEQAPRAPQPLLDWATLHAGLATALAGKLDDAHPDFEKLSQYGSFSEDPFDQGFAAFMTMVGKRMIDDEPIRPEETQKLDRTNYQAIGFLVFGVKDWELGEFEMAQTLFRLFKDAKPEPPDDWISAYRKFPLRYDQSFDKFQAFSDQVKEIAEPDKAKDEIPKLKASLATLDLHGSLLRKANVMVRKIQQAVDDAESERNLALTEMEGEDAKDLSEAKAKGDEMALKFNFREAYTATKGVQAVTEKGKANKKGLLNRYDWLISFKAQLTQDMGAKPYTGTITRKSGSSVTGQISDADDTNVTVKGAAGNTKIPWTDISFESLVEMARANLRTDLPVDRLADRKWYLGTYCELVGHPEKAAEFFASAVKDKPEFEQSWKIFPDVPKP